MVDESEVIRGDDGIGDGHLEEPEVGHAIDRCRGEEDLGVHLEGGMLAITTLR